MVDETGRERASDKASEDAEAQSDTQATQRFVPRSPLDDLRAPNTTAPSDPVADASGTGDTDTIPLHNEEIGTGDEEQIAADPAAEVISLPANSDDLAHAEPITEPRSVSLTGEEPAPKTDGGGATQWLNRLRAATTAHQASTPAVEPTAPDTSDTDEYSTSGARKTPASAPAEAEDESQPNPDEHTQPVITIRAGDTGTETSICPVCGQETDALRFCGYCGSPLGKARVAAQGTSRVDQLWQRMRDLVDPPRHVVSTWPHAITFGGGALLVMLSLLSNSAGMALVIACAIVPVLILLTLNQRDVFESESPLVLAAVTIAGGVAGIIVGWLGKIVVAADWFDTGVLNFGAAGFGGKFAEQAGSASILVWAINGVLLPLVGLAGMVAVPIALRRFNTYRNEVMDGAILTGAGAAGFAIGSAIIFWAPIFNHSGPSIDVSDWTLTIIGMAILRPVIITLAGAMLGAGIWRYMMTPKTSVLILPAAGSIGGMILLYLGSLWIQPSGGGIWPEALWLVLVGIAVFILYRLVLAAAIDEDRRALGSDGTRIVCLHCHRLTLKGAYCSRCGKPLPAEADIAPSEPVSA